MTGAMSDSELLPFIRERVRSHLLNNRAFRQLDRERQRSIAHDTVMALHYIVGGADGASRPASVQFAGDSPIARQLAPEKPPEGATAGVRFGEAGAVAAREGADALAGLIERVNFPKFVAGLIDGVFTAIVSSSIKQMEAYAELVANVAKSVEQFMKDNISENNARDYLADRYPAHLEVDISGDKPKLKPREGLDENNMPDFSSDLSLKEDVRSLDEDTAEKTLVPAARRRLAMDRQQLLATMVMMGVNRLVVTNGTIEASCLFELDTKDEVKRRFSTKRTADFHAERDIQSGAEGSYSQSGGGWFSDDTESKSNWFTKSSYRDSSNFKVSTTRSEDSTAKVEMHAKLAGKVNLQFKSDYFPMEKMVDIMQVNQIRSKTPNQPEAAAPGESGGVAPAQTGALPKQAAGTAPQPAAAEPAR
jgi:hypothetical protein